MSNKLNIEIPLYIKFEGETAKATRYYGYYSTESGKIISIKIKGGQGNVDPDNPRLHSIKHDKDGYCEVCLSKVVDGIHIRLYRRVHRIIWETYYGIIPNEMTIDHIDMNKENNSISNLRVLTREENTSIALKGKPSSKRNKYKVFQHDKLIGIYDRFELFEIYHITHKDLYYSNSERNKFMKKNGIIIEKI